MRNQLFLEKQGTGLKECIQFTYGLYSMHKIA